MSTHGFTNATPCYNIVSVRKKQASPLPYVWHTIRSAELIIFIFNRTRLPCLYLRSKGQSMWQPCTVLWYCVRFGVKRTQVSSQKKMLSQTNVYLLSDNNRIKQSEITLNVIYRCNYYTLINDNFQAPIHISLSLNIKL